MYNRRELDGSLLNDIKFKAENPPTKNDEYSKALFSTSITEDLEKTRLFDLDYAKKNLHIDV